jgi:hypothetical protein
MLIENKYSRWYYALIKKAQSRTVVEGYTENHHIIPHCLGGAKRKHNLVILTAREHFVAHCLLTRCVPMKDEIRMWQAVWMMQFDPSTKKRYKNSRIIAIAKEKMAKAAGDRIRGKKFGPKSDEAKAKIRKARAEQVIPKEAYERQAKVMSSLVWLNDGTRSYRVRPELVEDKLNQGLKQGRLMSFINEDYKQKRREIAINYWQNKSATGAQL